MILTVTLNAAIDKRYVVCDFQINSVNRVKECKYSAGGKGLNVSRVVAIAGEPVVATGFAGGYAGDYIINELGISGIQNGFVRIQGESRSCINIFNETDQTQTEFLEPGVQVSAKDQEEFADQYTELVKKCSVVAISGSVPKGVDASLYQRLIKIAKDNHKKVILDTSGSLLNDCISAKPTLIKPNMDEIKMLSGRNIESVDDIIEVAEEIQKGGVEIVVVSLGKKGSITVCSDGVYQAIVPEIDAVNTVGCGDSMIAGYAIGFKRGLTIVETIRLASAISAANALREETGFFIKQDMEAILPKVEVIKLK